MTSRWLCLPLALALAPAGCSRSSDAAPTRAAPAATVAREHDAEEAERRLPERALDVRINGKPVAAWQPEQIAKVPAMRVQNKQGAVREAWSIDELAHRLAGPTARVTALVGPNAKRVPVEAAPGRTLVLRVTRDGDYKAQWAEGAPLLHDVRGLELAQ
jgi:hypothetical protein